MFYTNKFLDLLIARAKIQKSILSSLLSHLKEG